MSVGSVSDDASSSDEEVQQQVKMKPLTLKERKIALQEKYVTLKSQMDLDWLERLDLINSTEVVVPEFSLQADKNDGSADDDFRREIRFFKQAQSAVLEVIPKLNELNVKTRRPVDYYAQMAKTDDHMKKVRERLQSQELIMERRDKARKLRELKKFSKQVQQQATEKNRKEKKEILEQLKKRRKLNKNSDDIFDGEVQKSNNPKKGILKNKNSKSAIKRKEKDKKYGFGGKKKRSKYNTAESSANVSEFRKPRAGG
uniref:rRNA-processing protein EBP2 n=1 Tax=Strigamia maritima TaxID=126957 RepID=T1J1X6_STRMM